MKPLNLCSQSRGPVLGHSGPRPTCYGTREARGGKLHFIFQVLYLFKHFSTQFYCHTCSSVICNAPKSYQVIERRQKLSKEIFFSFYKPWSILQVNSLHDPARSCTSTQTGCVEQEQEVGVI